MISKNNSPVINSEEIFLLSLDQKKALASTDLQQLWLGVPSSGKTSLLAIKIFNEIQVGVLKSCLVLTLTSHHRSQLINKLSSQGLVDLPLVKTLSQFFQYLFTNVLEGYKGGVQFIDREGSLEIIRGIQRSNNENENAEVDLEAFWSKKLEVFTNDENDFDDQFEINFDRYQQVLSKKELVDEMDLIISVWLFRERLSDLPFESIFIDELEDASAIELDIITSLVKHKKFTGCMSYDKGVMSWRYPLPILGYKKIIRMFKFASKYLFVQNFTTSHLICKKSVQLIRKNKSRQIKKMKSANNIKGSLQFIMVDDFEALAVTIIEKVEKLTSVDDEKTCGILLRTHKQTFQLYEALSLKINLIYYSHPLLRRSFIRKFIRLVGFQLKLNYPYEDQLLLKEILEEKNSDLAKDFIKELEYVGFSIVQFLSLFKKNRMKETDEWLFVDDYDTVKKHYSGTLIGANVCRKGDIFMGDNSQVKFQYILDDRLKEIILEKPIWIHLYSYRDEGLSEFAIECYNRSVKQTLMHAEGELLLSSLEEFKDELSELFVEYEDLLEYLLEKIRAFNSAFDFSNNNIRNINQLMAQLHLDEEDKNVESVRLLSLIFEDHYQVHLSFEENLKKLVENYQRKFEDMGEQSSNVFIGTLHESRKKHFDHVFIPCLNQLELPIGYASSPEEYEEERRLLFTGLTRAKENVYLYSTQKNNPHKTSSFIRDMKLF